MQIPHFDIAIIGAGPAGCTCALTLHQSGLRVVLVDKDTFPRDKVCGDAIPGPAFRVMDRISLKWGQALRAFGQKATVHTSRVIAPKGRKVSIQWVTYAYNAPRLDFDNFLIELVREETRTTVLQNTALQHLERLPQGIHCRFRDGSALTAALVIGCDGAYTQVGRQLGGIDLDAHNNCVAVRAYYEGIPDLPVGINEFHVVQHLLPGYFWIFPLGNGRANVGFGILGAEAARKNLHLRAVLEHLEQHAPDLAARLGTARRMSPIKGFALPLGTRKHALSGERFMLCGDAAALIDPLQGHGIHHAMMSGELAAHQALQCFQNSDFSAAQMHHYDQAIYRKIGLELWRNTWLLRAVLHFPFLTAMVGVFGRFEKGTNWLVRKLRF